MELRQIRYFVAVAEEENFTTAAKRMNVSQPPVTRQIQQLEAELGVKLFLRTQKGVEITPAGEEFLKEAQQILTHSQRALVRSRSAERGEIGELRIAYFGSSIFSFIPRAVHSFCQDHKSVDVSLHPMRKKEQIAAVIDQRVHLGFGRHYPHVGGLKVETIGKEKILVALSATHPLAERKSISRRMLNEQSFIVFPQSDRPSFADEVIQIMRSAGVEPNIKCEAPDLTTALALAAAEMGVCPVPESVSQLNWANLRLLSISGVNAKCQLNCVYTEDQNSPILSRFLDVIRSVPVSPP